MNTINSVAYGLCYQIIPKFEVKVGIYTGFYIEMDNSLNYTNDIPESVEIMITSENNSYGISTASWTEGNTLDVKFTSTDLAKEALIDLKPTQYKMYQPTSNCSIDVSYYKCLGFRFLQMEQYQNCTKFCIPIIYQTLMKLATNDSFEICENPLENACMAGEILNINFQASMECSKSCMVSEYGGKVKYYSSALETSYGSWYMIFPSTDVSIVEEYLIYDFIGMVGSIGGTLGLFIGFSFMDLFFWIVNILFKK